MQVSKEPGSRDRTWVSLGDFPDLALKDARDLSGWVRMKSPPGWSAERIGVAVRADNDALSSVGSSGLEKKASFRDVAEVWFGRKRIGSKNGKPVRTRFSTR